MSVFDNTFIEVVHFQFYVPIRPIPGIIGYFSGSGDIVTWNPYNHYLNDPAWHLHFLIQKCGLRHTYTAHEQTLVRFVIAAHI